MPGPGRAEPPALPAAQERLRRPRRRLGERRAGKGRVYHVGRRAARRLAAAGRRGGPAGRASGVPGFGSLFGCCRHIMATRGAEAARGGGSSSGGSAAGRSRRQSQSQGGGEAAAAAAPSGSPELVGGAMEEAGSREMEMNNQDQLVNRKCNELSDIALQHAHSNCYGLENTGTLEEAEYITKNRKHLVSTCCSQESREETPGREEARTDPPDGQQDPESEKHKEKTLGKEVLLLMQALNTLSTPEEKLAALCKKYADLHIDKVFKHKELQQQLVDAKLQQTTQLIKEAEEKHQREREFLLKEATESRHKCEQMKQQEAQLKQQLSLYMDKFEEFQTTMAKSNELFTTFRQEMEKMTKKIKKLEKETIVWRTKWENNNKALLQMAEEKTVRDKEYKGFQIKLERLEKLCRALQTERNELNEKVEVLKEQVSLREADVDLAVQVLQSCTLNSHEELGTPTDMEPGIQPDVESRMANSSKKTVSTSPVPGTETVD
ncbi:gamma-taxilin isoform X2 [Aquila chrysaetos chrysaetos]|uniref:gamma-taxilin isoform X2 n=1 Tax=Aquila chrysaetos chrysaetos TaxID=223781 RepID=UPI001B7D35A7|nr:gamma-taxilin isoform X2 [Aquila chrysaetos chrysaetos]